MNQEIEKLKSDLVRYKQKFLYIEEAMYDLQISMNSIMSLLDEILDHEDEEEKASGAV